MRADIRVALVPLDRIQFHAHNVRRDLGDLRTLAGSIARYGVMQPIVVERRGDMLRIRAGHRRVAAARLAGLTKAPAVVHPEPLEDDEWLAQAVQENVMRRGLDAAERRDAIAALRDFGCTWQGVADTFGVAETTVRSWVDPERPKDTRPRSSVKRSTVASFVRQWREHPKATAADVLAALDRMAATGRLADALPSDVVEELAA